MAYEEYRNSGRTNERCLYQLEYIGVPLYILPQLVFKENEEIFYISHLYATYKWNENNVPVFNFVDRIRNALKQLPIFTLYISKDNGETFVEMNSFSDPIVLNVYLEVVANKIKILNKFGKEVNTETLLPIDSEVFNIRHKN